MALVHVHEHRYQAVVAEYPLLGGVVLVFSPGADDVVEQSDDTAVAVVPADQVPPDGSRGDSCDYPLRSAAKLRSSGDLLRLL